MNGKVMLEIKPVFPHSDLWSEFIALYGEYFQRCWPDVFGDASVATVAQENEKQLVSRHEQGGRGLFLLFKAKRPVGLSNVWLDKGRVTTLNVAEFYIRQEHHRAGLGSALWYAMQQWGRRHGATHIQLETDADKPANAFWRTRGLRPSSGGGNRVCYRGAMPPLPILWIRHGQVAPLDHLDYCPEDREIALAPAAAARARALGARLLDRHGGQQIFTSPQRRALETARALMPKRRLCGLPVLDSALCEFFPQELIGMKLAAIPRRYGEDYAFRLLHTPLDTPFHASESAWAAVERIDSFMKRIGDGPITCSQPIVLSHQNLHNLFVAYLMGADLNASGRLHIDNLHGTTFLYDPFLRRFDIKNLNTAL
jgi:broad specificity phosphatase PhoE/GNAT superfamily N-acetyltransferase